MKKVPIALVLAYFAAWMITFSGCKKDTEIPTAELPTLTTTVVSGITTSSAVAGGNVTSSGGAKVTARGVCWSTLQGLTVSDSKTIDGTGPGTFTSSIIGLTPNTTYHVRAYATNSAGTAYGNEISFITQDTPAGVTTTAIVSFTSTTAVVTGNVVYGQTGYLLIGSGVCWSTSQNPTTADSIAPNTTYSGIFTSNLTGLTQGTTYFVRTYAEYESSPTIYGNELSFTTSFDPGTGTQKADFPGGPRIGARGFSISTKIYMGLGNDGENQVSDFWEWDQTSNVWTRKADYPGNSAGGEVGFSIGTKGYIEAGGTNQFWEYDPATNTWTQKSSFPGALGIVFAVGFSIGTKGYIGTGYIDGGYAGGAFSQEFWEWDQATNVWTRKADFAGNERSDAVGFSIGNKGYIGTGSGQGSTAYTDFWEWDQSTNTWTRKADFAGMARQSAVGFSIGDKGYIGTGHNYSTYGYKKDFWEWDQTTNVWTQKANIAGSARAFAVGFSMGNNGYIGIGSGSDGNVGHPLQDFWEYDPTHK